jgi:pyrroloquinoline quinone (PQQ) biosynthesis protein C
MAHCPGCKLKDVYYPFYGAPECSNSTCKYFTVEQQEAAKVAPEPAQMVFNYSEDDEDDGMPTYAQAVANALARQKKK